MVLLHGYGADARDLANVIPQLPQEFVYASLCAPFRCGMSPLGFEWFPLHFHADGSLLATETPELLASLSAGASRAAEGVAAWLESLNPRPARVALLGFSQGGIVATSLLRAQPDGIAATVIVSSLVAPQAAAGADEALAERRPPVWWGRGDRDEVIPANAVAFTSEWMRTHATVDEIVEPGLGHEFSERELVLISDFLRRHVVSAGR